ncbi:hypothetical protein M9458_000919, partial [Cirrhinus mrigala]
KLHTEHKGLTSELEKVFGPGLEINVEDSPGTSEDTSQTTIIIVLGVLLVISFVFIALGIAKHVV